MNDDRPSALVEAYLAKRRDLVRYFTMRLGSEAAAEDVVQEMYVRIVTAEVGEVENPAAFLYRLGSNLMLDKIKQQRRTNLRETAWRDHQHARVGAEDIVDAPSAEDVADSRQRLARLVAAIEELPPQRRRAFQLHKLQGLTHGETAAAMGVSRSAIEKHISAALKHLLSRLGS